MQEDERYADVRVVGGESSEGGPGHRRPGTHAPILNTHGLRAVLGARKHTGV